MWKFQADKKWQIATGKTDYQWGTATQYFLYGSLKLLVEPMRRMHISELPVGPDPRWF